METSAQPDKGENTDKTSARGSNKDDDNEKGGGQRELRSSDKSESDEEKRVCRFVFTLCH